MLSRRVFGRSLPLTSDFDRTMGDLASVFSGNFSNETLQFPVMNVGEEENGYFAEVETPGVKAEDVDIKVKGNILTVHVTHDKSTEEKKDKYHRRERMVGESTRSITFPVEIDSTNVEANLKDGVLHIHLPKAETEMTRKIEVKAN